MSKKTQSKIKLVCKELAEWLCDKNDSYGDSAISPIRIRSNADPIEQIRVRQDDKLNRLFNNQSYDGDDDLKDLVGYWVLEQVAIMLERKRPIDPEPIGKTPEFVDDPIWPHKGD